MSEIQEAPVKKGRRSWDAVDQLAVLKKREGWRYRHCDRTNEIKMSQRIDQGWVFVNRETGIPGELAERPTAPGTAGVRRELVLMALPEELGKERDAWIAEKASLSERAIKSTLQNKSDNAADAAGAPRARIDGRIVIE